MDPWSMASPWGGAVAAAAAIGRRVFLMDECVAAETDGGQREGQEARGDEWGLEIWEGHGRIAEPLGGVNALG